MARIRSCQGTSARFTAGKPLAGVKAAGAVHALCVLGMLNAEPSVSAGAAGGASRPSGSENSEVVSDSPPVCRGTASPCGISNSDVVDDSPSADAGTPPGCRKALRASSDCGLGSSASVTCATLPGTDTPSC